MYRTIIERFEVSPKEAIVVGDDIDLDILIPRKLGMKTILLNRSGESKDTPEPDAIVSNLDEAVEVVKVWAKG